MRMGTVQQANIHLSRPDRDAHAGATIVPAWAGAPWARPMPLESPPPRRIPDRRRHQGPLRQANAPLEAMTPQMLSPWKSGSPLPVDPLP